MKISVKIISLMILTAMGIAIVFGLIGVDLFKKNLQDSVGLRQLDVAHNLMYEIDSSINERTQFISLVANSVVIRDALDENGDKDSGFRRLQDYKGQVGFWKQLAVYDLDQKLILASEGDCDVQSEKVMDIVSMALAGDVAYSDVFFCDFIGENIMLMSAPIYENTDRTKISGVIVGFMSWEVVLSKLENSNMHTHLYSSKGDLIAASDKLRLNPINNNYNHYDNYNDFSIAQYFLRDEYMGVLDTFSKDEKMLATIVTQKGVDNFKGYGWKLLVETPVSAAFSAIDNSINNFILIIIFSVCLYTLILYFFVNKLLAKPIKSLMSVASTISNGNYSMRSKIKSNDEIGQLAENLNVMADNLIKVNEKNSKIINSLPEAMFVLDDSGLIVNVNQAAIRIFGYSKEDFIGKKLNHFFDEGVISQLNNKKDKIIKYIPQE